MFSGPIWPVFPIAICPQRRRRLSAVKRLLRSLNIAIATAAVLICAAKSFHSRGIELLSSAVFGPSPNVFVASR